MWRCEIKKVECREIIAFELWCWRRLLKVPLTAQKFNQSILKEINPASFGGWADAYTEAPILWSHDLKSQLIGKDPDAGKELRQKKEAAEDEMVV